MILRYFWPNRLCEGLKISILRFSVHADNIQIQCYPLRLSFSATYRGQTLYLIPRTWSSTYFFSKLGSNYVHYMKRQFAPLLMLRGYELYSLNEVVRTMTPKPDLNRRVVIRGNKAIKIQMCRKSTNFEYFTMRLDLTFESRKYFWTCQQLRTDQTRFIYMFPDNCGSLVWVKYQVVLEILRNSNSGP